MQNKPISTPQKSLRSYLNTLQRSPYRRNSIFSQTRTPSTSKTVHFKNPLLTQPRTRTEPVQHRSTQDLVNQMASLLNTIKAKYAVYVKAEQDNIKLHKENDFLKGELAQLRKQIAGSQQEVNVEYLKRKNEVLEDKFWKATKQLKQLKKIYVHDREIAQGFEQILRILTVDPENL